MENKLPKLKLPPVHRLRRLLWFMNERQLIYLKRAAGTPWPWTDDPVLRSYRFCNVFREQDKVTRQFAKMLRKPYADHPNLWFLYCLARQINWPDTVAEILVQTDLPDKWKPDTVYKVMRQRQLRGDKVYTSAYMLRGDIQSDDGDNNKPKYTAYKVLSPVWKDYQARRAFLEKANCTIEAWVQYLTQFEGWGRFLAYEVATDLRHTRYLCGAPDIMTFANIGPGAKRGLNRLYKRPLNAALSEKRALEELLCIMGWIRTTAWIDDSTLTHRDDSIEPRDVEHSLCEFDKYERAQERLQEGRNPGLERFKVALV